MESAQDSIDDSDGTYSQSKTLIAHEMLFSYGLLVGTRSTDGLLSVPVKYSSRYYEEVDDDDDDDLEMPDASWGSQSSINDIVQVAVPQNQSYKSDVLDIPSIIISRQD